MFSNANKTKKSFITAISMSLILLLGSALGFLLETKVGQITKPSLDVWTNHVETPTGAGTSVDDPYIIDSPGKLAYFAKNELQSTTYLEITADLDFSAHKWETIEASFKTIIIEGNNHKINNLIGASMTAYCAVNVSNLIFSNIDLRDEGDIALISKGSGGGLNINCKNIVITSGNIVSTGSRSAAGFACGVYGSTFENCVNNANIYSMNGAAYGFTPNGNALKNCINTGNITGKTAAYGIGNSNMLENCYVECTITVTGETNVSAFGLTGDGIYGGAANTTNCGFKGDIIVPNATSGTVSVFAKKGHYSNGTITNSFGIADVFLGAGEEHLFKIFPENSESSSAKGDVPIKSSYVYAKVNTANGITEKRKYKVIADETEPFKDMVYNKNINSGYPFPKSLFAVGQFIECDTMSYLQDYAFNSIEIKNDGTHYYIEYGLYPQTYVGSEMADTLNTELLEPAFPIGAPEENCAVHAYRYNGQYYAKIDSVMTREAGFVFENGEEIINGNSYWFKFEPIKWLVLNYDEYIKGKPLTVIADKVLNVIPFNFAEMDGNLWETSLIRDWLNKGFYSDAFTSTKQDKVILEVEKLNNNFDSESDGVGDTTKDSIWLLSKDELMKYFPTEEDRKCRPTDFALANNVMVWSESAGDTNQFSYWWLRTAAITDQRYVKGVRPYGEIYDNLNELNDCGVRPVMTLNI